MQKNKDVMVAMSGGVDSSVAAFLLKEQGFNPVGATMCFGLVGVEENPRSCCDPKSVADAKRVCQKLGIPHYVFDYASELKEYVIDNFLEEYKLGRTPNPCVRCNTFLKFQLLLNRAKELNIQTIATGHYAKITEDESNFYLETADDKIKDQSYFLWGIKKRDLPNIVFPISHLQKTQLRKIAEEAGLPTAQKQDSQDICFVSGSNYRTLLSQYGIEQKKGKMFHIDGRELGEHSGIENYTVGQRKGLGIALGEPAFVCDIDVKNNIVIIGNRNDLLADGCLVENCNFLQDVTEDGEYSVKIRSTMSAVKCGVKKISENSAEITFDEPQFAVTRGQSAVVYDENRVVFGSIIERRT
ncbi:MAG: tRNA 2-thiouridine(34) synthase MnmA [Chitinivibrionia bacterium]|nr:tRNA 2-thiouridine(34) synthase MnmA [Chitinivibrionia bacterium]